MKKIVYLCVPYSSADEHVREYRAIQADKAAARIINMGHIVFSPISHSHRVAHHMDNHNDGELWIEQDIPFLEMADEVAILKIDGWDKSKGIAKETLIAKRLNKPVWYMEQE